MPDVTEIDRDAFHKRIERYVGDAETYLKLPPGSIGTLSGKHDSDFVLVIKMCGVIEPLMKDVIRETIRSAIEHPKTATSGSEALMKAVGDLPIDKLRNILVEFGGIDERTSRFIQALFSIRNRYAHHISNAHLTITELCQKISSETNGDKNILSKLISFDIDQKSIATSFINILIFYNLALFLQSVLNLINPPPLFPDGILNHV